MTELTIDELKKKAKEEPYYIYGFGVVGRRLLDALTNFNLKHNFKGYIVTHRDETAPDNVLSYDSINLEENPLIFVAVHNVNVESIEQVLRNSGARNYYWVYNELLDLSLGEPIEEKTLEVRQLVKSMNIKYMHAIFFLMIDDVINGNSIGKKLFLNLQMKSINRETAIRKTVSFEQRIKEYSKKPKENEIAIIINQNQNLCLDGNHRLMLAYYFKVKKIRCKIYSNETIEKYVTYMETMNKYFFYNPDEKEICKNHSKLEAELIIDTMKMLNE